MRRNEYRIALPTQFPLLFDKYVILPRSSLALLRTTTLRVIATSDNHYGRVLCKLSAPFPIPLNLLKYCDNQ